MFISFTNIVGVKKKKKPFWKPAMAQEYDTI